MTTNLHLRSSCHALLDGVRGAWREIGAKKSDGVPFWDGNPVNSHTENASGARWRQPYESLH